MNEQVERIVKKKLITECKDNIELCSVCEEYIFNGCLEHIKIRHPSVISAIEAGIEVGINIGRSKFLDNRMEVCFGDGLTVEWNPEDATEDRIKALDKILETIRNKFYEQGKKDENERIGKIMREMQLNETEERTVAERIMELLYKLKEEKP